MTREEFSNELKGWREASKITKYAIRKATGLKNETINTMEGGVERNYGMTSVFKYLSCVECDVWIHHTSMNKTYIVSSTEALRKTLIKIRGLSNLTQPQVAHLSEIGLSTYGQIEAKGCEYGIRVDIFLKVFHSLGCTIKIMPRKN